MCQSANRRIISIHREALRVGTGRQGKFTILGTGDGAARDKVPGAGIELEPFSGRERSGSTLAKSRAKRGTYTTKLVPGAGIEPARTLPSEGF